MRLIVWVALIVAVLPVMSAADAVIHIEKDAAGKVGISLDGVSAAAASGALFKTTLARDLERSGWFVVRSGASVAVSGTCSESTKSVDASLRVVNTADGRTFVSQSLGEDRGQARRLAHRAADLIVERVLGKRGIASTRIALIGARGGRKDVYMCDADGGNMVNVTRKGVVCLGPNWGPKGDSLVYTSFHKGFADVYRIDLRRKTLGQLAGYPGLNAGADVSPDGRRVVLTLSKDGNPDLYVMELHTRRLTRITRTPHGAEASPSWSPDGRQVVFVSDRSGFPQLYVVSATGGTASRVTFRGSENVAPDWGPDGRIVYSSRREGRYQLCIVAPGRRDEEPLTNGAADCEDPSWAPDGRHVVYSRTERYHSDLYILDTNDSRSVRLTTLQGDWYSPAWSPK